MPTVNPTAADAVADAVADAASNHLVIGFLAISKVQERSVIFGFAMKLRICRPVCQQRKLSTENPTDADVDADAE